MCGGLSEETDVTNEETAFCEEVRQEVETKVGKERVQVYQPLTYRSQVVEGINYFVKVQIDNDGNCLFLKLFEQLPCYKDPKSSRNVELVTFLDNKCVDDPLKYFE